MATTAAASSRRTLLEWLGKIGYWAIAGPFTLLMIAFGVVLPAAAAVWVAEWTFSTGILALEVAVAAVLLIVTSAGVWFAFSRPRVVKRLRLGRFEPALWALLVAFFAVASFAAVTSLLYLEGAIAISEPIEREILIDKTAEVYVWHLFDTVPLLDIPQNLEWQVPFEFEDRLGGLLLILFTAIVILPLIQVVRLIATGYGHPYEDAVLRALHTNERRAQVLRQPGRHNELAVVEGDVHILVDLMQDVSTEDYPLRRVGFASAYHYRRGTELRGVDGYLLVVDKVAERARDRIEEAFAGSAFPAALAVWRSDQPAAHLGEAVDYLAARIEEAWREDELPR